MKHGPRVFESALNSMGSRHQTSLISNQVRVLFEAQGYLGIYTYITGPCRALRTPRIFVSMEAICQVPRGWRTKVDNGRFITMRLGQFSTVNCTVTQSDTFTIYQKIGSASGVECGFYKKIC